MTTITVNDYSIDLTERFREQSSFSSLTDQNAYSKIFVLADEHTREFCLPLIAPQLPTFELITIPSGEGEKNIDTCKFLWEQLLSFGADRNSLLINLGGGVIGDMGGFVASTFKRGFSFVNIPTTLLSQVDASVGGKLGIDLNGVKNLVGVFNNPEHIFIATEFLHTLPFEQLRSGFAEMLKHGLIRDKTYWQELNQIDLRQFDNPVDLVRRSIEIKKDVVDEDPFEKGLRKILNFGHTIGHAVETLSLNGHTPPLLHGEAIAIGMICEAWLSAEMIKLPHEAFAEIVNGITQYFPKQDISAIRFDELMQIMRMDKKNRNSDIRFSLLHAIGSCGYDITADEQLIAASLHYYNRL